MECLYCGKNIGPLRKFLDQEYCSNTHREAHRKKQNDLALDFLLKTKPRYAPEPKAAEQPDAGEPLAAADTAQPVAIPQLVEIPQLAGFRTSRVPWAVGGTSVPQRCEPPSSARATALPEATGPRATTSFELRKAASQPPLAAASPARDLCAVKSTPAGFVCQAVRVDLRSGVARPLWLGPSKLEPGKKRPRAPERASFTKILIDWNKPTLGPACSPAVAPFEPVVTNGAAELFRTQPAFDLASFLAKRPAQVRPAPDCTGNRHVAAWQFSSAIQEWACAPLAESRAIGFPLCPGSACIPLQATFPAAVPGARVPSALAFELKPREASTKVILRQPMLAVRNAQAVQTPVATRARVRKTGLLATHPAEFRIRLDTPRFRPVRPRDNLAFPAAGVISGRTTGAESTESREPANRKPSLDFRLRAAMYWRRVPGWFGRTAVAAAVLTVCGFAVSAYIQSPTGMGHRQALQAQITRRAAIELEDDFRGGLSRWSGSAGWASSWSFDDTGTARSGKLALFEPSLSLTDYRVEFMGEIEKLAIGWVFRASDMKNYYATKLVETGHGPMPGLSLVRYAVIEGHQRLKVQLPLPVVPGRRSMHRIRQEIRGTQFTTFLDGRLIDTWSDTSLARGGVGFFSDSGEVAYLRWVTIAQQDDTLGRICAWLSPRLR